MTAVLTRDVEAARRDLDVFGYCLLQDALSAEEVARYKAALQAAAGSSGGVMNLIGRAPAFLDLVQHAGALEFADYQLGPDFLLSGSNAIIQRPGAPAQRMHNDQAYVPPPWNYPVTMNIVWMLDDFTAANGATRVVPKSHLLNVETPNGIRSFEAWLGSPIFTAPLGEPIAVEGPAGTALIMDGRIWHNAGPNSTTDQRRHGVQTYYCRPHMRQQTCFHLSLPADILEQAKQS
ncbi:phytanoyl-CoA dioxygenase family protein, partial [uncultured Phenylobacterium sp.]|uniref:phytanoyl-CoA dioxygenase family protein n=1 Tax=uncultured Phenylobacterium sp. TaxID=349273 RepID=UPI0025DEA072